uniref:Uncharacterized protein n=2 Tax=Amphora coffeiformis TaxID=265554 RepID=A0A7S3KXL0_9STRA
MSLSTHLPARTSSNGASVDPSTLRDCEERMEHALACLEKYLTQELLEAREIVPELVARETPLLDFWRTELNDPLKAAIRLAKYWKARKVCFVERWLLPLNQTGAGALTMEDVELLRTGSRALIKRPGEGFLVIIDDSRLPRSPGMFFFRLMFYAARLHNDEVTQRDGATFVYIVNSKATPTPNLDKQTYQMVDQGLPMKTKAYHVVQVYEEGRKEYMDYMGFKQSKIVRYRNAQINPNLIVADSFHGTRTLLQQLGLRMEHLPRCVGGSYDYRQFTEWTRMRLSVEDIMSSTPVFANNLLIASNTKPAPPGASKTRGRGDEDTKAKALVAREINASKARRCYHRRELQLLVLQEQSRAFSRRNAELRKDNARIEDLLLQARARVALEEFPYFT